MRGRGRRLEVALAMHAFERLEAYDAATAEEPDRSHCPATAATTTRQAVQFYEESKNIPAAPPSLSAAAVFLGAQ
ncbi:hypothetical protein CMUS01_06070 [Colletotrichum musicola]|uniref:Uncharacterized protein n=1 Tax=Colletotrichum musicola TaxID=2175873 RepID=A0A8H6KNY9_9PEZI|nr:hypothetical protein CMUS01_06070 [Colletotrichum musicola]